LNAHPLNPGGGSRVAEDPNGHPWDPHQADKDVEVGNYYLKHKNYRAALERFRSALLYKPNDAEATFGLAVTQEHMELLTQAYRSYSKYLEILPHGPQAQLAQDAMKRIGPRIDKDPEELSDSARQAARALQQGETFLAHNDYDAARLRFEDAARLTPEDPVVYFRLAQSLQGLQRLDPARTLYKKYLELQPSGPFAADAKKSIQQISEVLGK
jgi:Flp pilus assembly protein TadD